jgi:catechol 2,3-dioxygenase-like lactoylglutathione lyase family enzyme
MSLSTFTESITFFYTHNLAKTAHFYEQLMGLQLVLDQGDCRIYQVSPGGFIGFCKRGTAPENPEGVIFTFVTENVDGWAARLRANGVLLEKEPAPNPDYNIYNCFFRDPNGYLLEIQRFLDSDWMMGKNR